jgi:hypothetical protein
MNSIRNFRLGNTRTDDGCSSDIAQYVPNNRQSCFIQHNFTVALSFVLSATSLWLGYQLGARWHNNDRGQIHKIPDANRSEDDDDDQEDIADGDLAAVKAGLVERCKLVGILAVQCSRAFLTLAY